jgi:TP901 family phage tail tape measure protein
MAQKKIVKTDFRAQGNIDKKFTLWERAAARFGRRADKSFKRVSRNALSFQNIMKGGLGFIGISSGINLVSQGVGSLTNQFIAFDKAALGATVRFKDIGPEAADFNQQLKLIEKSARDAGATTEFTAAQAADSLDFLARAGFTSAEAMGSLSSMINLATASGEEFATVADMSSDLLGAFGLNAKDTTQKISNLNRLNDVLVKSANSANVTIESMFETMKTAAPIGRTLGIELEEVAALASILGSAGIKGTEAGTALKNSFLNLSAATPSTIKMLKAIGVEVDDGTGNMRKFTDILADIGDRTKDLGTLKTAQIFNEIFGKRAIAGATNLADSIGELRDFEKMLKGAGKTSELTAEIMRQSLDARIKALGSAATEAGFKIFDGLGGANGAAGGIDKMTESIRNADLSGLITIMNGLVLILKVVLFLVNKIARVFDIVGTFIGESVGKLVTARFMTGAGETSLLDAVLTNERLNREKAPQRIGPNQQEAAARSEQLAFQGRLEIAGAPEGSTFESGPAPPGFEVAMLGAN